MPTITDEDLQAVDLSKPLPIQDSPLLKEDPERAELMLAKIGNPLELQQFNAVEIRAAIDQRIKKDMEELGSISESTLKWMKGMNDVLSDLHKNMYGTKSMQVQVQGKITHAQIASMMRQAKEEGRVVDVTPEKEEET